MAGKLIVDTIDTDNAFITLNVQQSLIATMNVSGIFSNTGVKMIGANGTVSNTAITGLVTASQIANVANTQITGLIQAAQIGSANATLITSGTLPGARLPTGSVLQVANATYSTTTSTSTTTYADSGLTVSITPSSATSKVLVLVSINGVSKSGVDCCLNARLNRDATSISNITGLAAYTGTTATGTGSAAFNYLDSPASTSSTTYKVQIASSNAGRSVSINDYAAVLGSVSAITVMEISA